VHLTLPTTHLPALHVPALRPTGRLPVATALLSLCYAIAIAVALAAPGEHALAGCAVLAGLVCRTVVRRRRSAVGAVQQVTGAVDAVLPGEATATAPATAA
jgi:hypothetical protein